GNETIQILCAEGILVKENWVTFTCSMIYVSKAVYPGRTAQSRGEFWVLDSLGVPMSPQQ
ncbi:MAG: hypothetical protein LBM69_06100, partial [Lachnospiraceae bacterium]|nr:hypothetical protein [Lachnospiraceae bacterium]